MKRAPLVGFAVAALLAVAVLPVSAQCAMCKTVLEGSSEGRRIASNLNHAILLMFFAPYLVFGSFVALVFRGRIRGWLAARSLWPPASPLPSRRS
jgi:hypothetical protein